jgi:hypothetical protein
MELTAEELAVYGVIDAETYIELSEALIARTTTIRHCFCEVGCSDVRTDSGAGCVRAAVGGGKCRGGLTGGDGVVCEMRGPTHGFDALTDMYSRYVGSKALSVRALDR